MGQLCSITYVQEEGRGGGWGNCVQLHTYKRRGGWGVGQLCSIIYVQREGGVGGGATVCNCIQDNGAGVCVYMCICIYQC